MYIQRSITYSKILVCHCILFVMHGTRYEIFTRITEELSMPRRCGQIATVMFHRMELQCFIIQWVGSNRTLFYVMHENAPF